MAAVVRPRDPAENLRIGPPLGQRRHRPLLIVRRLFFQPRPVDRPSIQSRRRPGLQPRHGQSGIAHLLGQTGGSALPDTPPGLAKLATEEPTPEKGPGA